MPLQRARGGDRGATLVEYSLVVALLIVPSLGAVRYLSAQANSQVNNQGECVSTRPPPPSCQRPVIVTTTTTAAPVGTGPPPPPPPPPPPDDVSAWSGNPSWISGSGAGTGLTAKVRVQVTPPPTAVNVAGAVVHFNVRWGSMPPVSYTATTDASGVATLQLTNAEIAAAGYGSATTATIQVTLIDTPNGVSGSLPSPASQTVTKT